MNTTRESLACALGCMLDYLDAETLNEEQKEDGAARSNQWEIAMATRHRINSLRETRLWLRNVLGAPISPPGEDHCMAALREAAGLDPNGDDWPDMPFEEMKP